jgi:hypothetical protein
MPFRFASPEDLTRLEDALERAWAIVEARHVRDPLKAPAERERLAYIVAALWQQGEQADIPAKAAEQFDATAPFPSLLGTASGEPPV